MEKPFCNPELWGGIECTINRVGDEFFDQLQYAGHYDRPADIDALASLGIRRLRYPILWEKHQPSPDTVIDWQWTRSQLQRIGDHGIDVIAGLLHHGSGPAFTSLADPQFPEKLACYAGLVAEAFPQIRFYTPVNEPLTTARFSGLYGLWYPHQRNARAFIQMLLNQLRGVVLSMKAIRSINSKAKLVQTEDLGKTYSTPLLSYQAAFENERRWLTYDLLCGKVNKHHPLWKQLLRWNVTERELAFFTDNPCPPEIIGFNHYLTSERYLDERLELYPSHTHGGNGRHRYADVEAVRVRVEDETGLALLLREAWQRFGRPMALTEVHLHCHREEQLRWFRHVWDTCSTLRKEGVSLEAVTSWAMLGSFGWNRLLTRPGGDYEAGVFDLRGGKPVATALAPFIRETVSTGQCKHPLAIDKGWWERPSRILFGTAQNEIAMEAPFATRPILILGRTGTLGQAFARICTNRLLSHQLVGRADCDICDPGQVAQLIARYEPWAIINAAGYVRVDDAEGDEEACLKANSFGPQNLAIACAGAGIRLVNFSSDLVFDGDHSTPYTESSNTNPLNVYGRSKQLCEELVLKAYPGSLVIRTSAFFGPWDEYNFLHYVRRSLEGGEVIRVAGDLIISPTYVPHLVHATLDLLIDGESGIRHLANEGSLSWSELALRTARHFQLNEELIKSVPSARLGYRARRPAYSVLGTEKGRLLPSFEAAFEAYAAEHRPGRPQQEVA
jgi:dTDP-4-dehydrorhamnose reductase